MAELAVVEVARVMTPAEATAMIGDDVPQAAPNIANATVARDGDTGEPVFAYLPLGDVSGLRRAVLGFAYGTTTGQIRSDGTRVRSRTFGYGPRRPVYRREGCSPTTMAGEAPAAHAVITGYSDRLAELLDDIDPDLRARGEEAVSEVLPDWRLGESKLWTSGVINQTAVLPWHRDAFNFPAWSAMPVLRRHVDGGHLRIAEYDATIACRDGWGVFFAGYTLVHGVTPMRLRRRDGYRFSLVYYALKGMKNCFEAAEETAYARRRRTEREQSMAQRLAEGRGDEIDGRPAGPDPHPATAASGGRLMGTRPVGKADLTGDPTAIEDAYLAERDARDEQADRVRRNPPPGRPAGFDPRLVRKKGFRLMGGRGQDEFLDQVERSEDQKR